MQQNKVHSKQTNLTNSQNNLIPSKTAIQNQNQSNQTLTHTPKQYKINSLTKQTNQ